MLDSLGDPKPSQEQLQLALVALVAEGTVERDPKQDKAGATYRYRHAQPHLPRNLPMVVGEVGPPPLTESQFAVVALAEAQGPPF